jgi:hypothetical protein
MQHGRRDNHDGKQGSDEDAHVTVIGAADGPFSA